MAALDAALGRPDAAVFLAQAEALRGLRHPFLGEAEILHAERWLDADHGVVLQVCRRIRDESLEARQDLTVAGAGKLAVRAQHPADAVLDRRVA